MDLLAAHINFDPDDNTDHETDAGMDVPHPTGCGPGTIGKVYVITKRALANQTLWHKSDAKHTERFEPDKPDIIWPQQMLLPWERKKQKLQQRVKVSTAYWYAFDWYNVATVLKLCRCVHVQVFSGETYCGDMLRDSMPVLSFSVPAKSQENFHVRVLIGRRTGEFPAGVLIPPLQQAAAIGPSFWPITSLSIFKRS